MADNWFQLNKMGGFGDLVMMTALFPEIKKRGFKLRVVVSDYYGDILEGHPMIDHYVRLPESDWGVRHRLCGLDSPKAMHSVDLKYPDWWGEVGKHKLDTHMIDLWMVQAGLKEKCSYVRPDPTLDQYDAPGHLHNMIFYQTKTGWSPYKDWPLNYWSELRSLIEVEYPSYRMLEIPHFDHIKNASIYLANCALFIGPDSVFNHVTKALGKKSIIIWGSTNPEAFGYDTHVNMVAGLKCQPCYREYSHIEQGKGCPVLTPTHEIPPCQLLITPEQVFEQVKLILGDPT